MINLAGRYNKAIGAFIVASISWSTLVVQSASADITASEWIAGGGLLATVVTTYLLGNTTPDVN